jgi:hypothetical protein
MAAGTPGTRTRCARQRSAPIRETSMWYVRPSMVSVMCCTRALELGDGRVNERGHCRRGAPRFKRKSARSRPNNPGVRSIRSAGRRKLFSADSFSTGYPPDVHRICTGRSPARLGRTVRTNSCSDLHISTAPPPPRRERPMPCTWSPERQRESLTECGHALEVELEAVLGRERADDLGLRTAGRAQQRRKPLEVAFEARRASAARRI